MKKTTKVLLAITAGAAFLTQQSQAGITYNDGDLLLNMRQTGGSSDLEVDLGSYTSIASLYGTGTSTAISGKFSLTDINNALGSINNAIFSITGTLQNGANSGGPAAYTDNTLWASKPRLDGVTPTTPWSRQPLITQGNAAGKIATVGNSLPSQTALSDSGNSAAQVATSLSSSYDKTYGTVGKIGGTFQGNTEVSVAANSANNQVVLDIYELLNTSDTSGGGTSGTVPTGTGSGTLLGYYTMNTLTGSLTFTAVPEASTYAAMIAGGLMLLSLFRVHRFSAVAK